MSSISREGLTIEGIKIPSIEQLKYLDSDISKDTSYKSDVFQRNVSTKRQSAN